MLDRICIPPTFLVFMSEKESYITMQKAFIQAY